MLSFILQGVVLLLLVANTLNIAADVLATAVTLNVAEKLSRYGRAGGERATAAGGRLRIHALCPWYSRCRVDWRAGTCGLCRLCPFEALGWNWGLERKATDAISSNLPQRNAAPSRGDLMPLIMGFLP